MAKREILAKKSMAHLLKAVSHLVQLPKTHLWLDYDEKADFLIGLPLFSTHRSGADHSNSKSDFLQNPSFI